MQQKNKSKYYFELYICICIYLLIAYLIQSSNICHWQAGWQILQTGHKLKWINQNRIKKNRYNDLVKIQSD